MDCILDSSFMSMLNVLNVILFHGDFYNGIVLRRYMLLKSLEVKGKDG